VGEGFDVSKSGDSRIGMIGFPSVGKSTLLTKLTDTDSKIAAYEFTTLTCIPGNLWYVKIIFFYQNNNNLFYYCITPSIIKKLIFLGKILKFNIKLMKIMKYIMLKEMIKIKIKK
jgi:GTPase Era involved in 16S rRNA processing